nr:MAG TPA: hypothetical protein [Bacteriophage sp.]
MLANLFTMSPNCVVSASDPNSLSNSVSTTDSIKSFLL